MNIYELAVFVVLLIDATAHVITIWYRLKRIRYEEMKVKRTGRTK